MFSKEDEEFFIDVLTNGMDLSAFNSISGYDEDSLLKDMCHYLNGNHPDNFYWVDDAAIFFDHNGIMGDIFCFLEGSILLFSLTSETPQDIDLCSRFAINILNYFYAKESIFNFEENLKNEQELEDKALNEKTLKVPSIYDKYRDISDCKLNKITVEMKSFSSLKYNKISYEELKNKIKMIIEKNKIG